MSDPAEGPTPPPQPSPPQPTTAPLGRVVLDTNAIIYMGEGKYSPAQIAEFDRILSARGFTCVAAQEVIFELGQPLATLHDAKTIERAARNFVILDKYCDSRLLPMYVNRFLGVLEQPLKDDPHAALILNFSKTLAAPILAAPLAQTIVDVAKQFDDLLNYNRRQTGRMFSATDRVRAKRAQKVKGAKVGQAYIRGRDRALTRFKAEPTRWKAGLLQSAKLASEPPQDVMDRALKRACPWQCALYRFLETKTTPMSPQQLKKRAKPTTGELNTGNDVSLITALFDRRVILISDDTSSLHKLLADCPEKTRVMTFESFLAAFK
ncbi:MAG: hypothetical protein M9894_17575 [Planctomycetes bacterium]|nr:hypothetical protein [Planctomycetota bacterium]